MLYEVITYFDTLRIALPQEVSTQHLQSVALSKEVNLRNFDNGDVGVSIDETTDVCALNTLISVFATAANGTRNNFV